MTRTPRGNSDHASVRVLKVIDAVVIVNVDTDLSILAVNDFSIKHELFPGSPVVVS